MSHLYNVFSPEEVEGTLAIRTVASTRRARARLWPIPQSASERVSVSRFLFSILFILLGLTPVSAQTDVPDALKNRPPVAAPTSQIAVAPIEVVRSQSETISDFGGGLIQGLLSSRGLRNAALIAAQDGRVIVTRDFGSTTDFDDVLYSDLLAPLAVLQLVDRQHIKLDDRVSGIVANYAPMTETIGDSLVHPAERSALLRITEAASGQNFRTYVTQNILSPLMSAGSTPSMSFTETMGRLLVVLINGGAFEGTQVLTPETIGLLQRTEFSIHPALPGWTYGFAEMRRNGRRALQRDGVWTSMPRIEARMVVVPDARIAYFVLVEGEAGASFWRALDDALFDRILPEENSNIAQNPQTPAPDAAQARDLADRYEASSEPLALVAPLKSVGQSLVVRAADDGSLRLFGAENAMLMPRSGGYWATDDGNLNAVASNGRLVVGSAIYRPLSWWRRPAPYASLGVISAVGAAGAYTARRRAQRMSKLPHWLAPALTCAVAAFAAVALFVWHLSPAL